MLKKCIGALMLTAIIPASAFAQLSTDRLSGGLKLGGFMVDSGATNGLSSVNGYSVDIDNGFGFGLHGDYKITENWYVDFEYMFTSLDVDVELDTNGSTASASSSIDVSSYAIYGAYRSTGDWYYLGKLGLISEDLSGNGAFSEREVGFSFSVGGGYKIQENFFLEAEFMSIEKDIGFFGLTTRYTFN